MTSPTTLDPNEQNIVLSPADLQRLIADVSQGIASLPPGAYRDEGGVWRDVLEPTGRFRTNRETGRRETISRRVRRRVLVTFDASPEGLLKAKRQAQITGQDFYHTGRDPKSGQVIGWLRGGVKREVDVPENLGTGSERFEMVYEPMATEDDESGTSATMQGVPLDMVEAPEPTPTRSDDGPDPFSDESLAAAAAQSRRGQKGT